MQKGRIYHIYNRGNNKETIFKEEQNYQFFLDRFKRYLSDSVKVHAYCLMPNHFHFLIEILVEPAEKAFKNFFISYAKSINKAYDRTGSLFQYKFKRKLVETDAQYGMNIAYIHYNPIKAGLTLNYADWQYSSYLSLVSGKPTLLKRDAVLDWFGNEEAFIEFHQLYMKDNKEREADCKLDF